jgi:hypothetical protein
LNSRLSFFVTRLVILRLKISELSAVIASEAISLTIAEAGSSQKVLLAMTP